MPPPLARAIAGHSLARWGKGRIRKKNKKEMGK